MPVTLAELDFDLQRISFKVKSLPFPVRSCGISHGNDAPEELAGILSQPMVDAIQEAN